MVVDEELEPDPVEEPVERLCLRLGVRAGAAIGLAVRLGEEPSLSQPHLTAKLRFGSTPSSACDGAVAVVVAEVLAPQPLGRRTCSRSRRGWRPAGTTARWCSRCRSARRSCRSPRGSGASGGVTISGVIHSRACWAPAYRTEGRLPSLRTLAFLVTLSARMGLAVARSARW